MAKKIFVDTEQVNDINKQISILKGQIEYKVANWKSDTALPNEYGLGVTRFQSSLFLGVEYCQVVTEQSSLGVVCKQTVSGTLQGTGNKVVKIRYAKGGGAGTNQWADATTIATQDEMNVLNDQVLWKQPDWKSASDLPTAYPTKSRTVFTITSSAWVIDGITIPTYSVVATTCDNGNITKQEFFRHSSLPLYYRLANASGGWGKLQQIATTDKVDILLQSNWLPAWSSNANNLIASRNGNIVTVTGIITSGSLARGTVICNLPRPIRNKWVGIENFDTGNNYYLYLELDGGLKIDNRPIIQGLYQIDFSYEVA